MATLTSKELRALKLHTKPIGERSYDGVHANSIHAVQRKGLVKNGKLTPAGRKALEVPDVFANLWPGRPEPFEDSFTTADACFSVEVKPPWGECTEDIEVKIDCGGMIHGDPDLIDLLIEMLENAKENYIARRGKLTKKRLAAL